ncbi:hypothetical protein M3P19_15590 [Muricauda sp. 2012CJ35-5]|uniref:Uncharacterized protein n=1 Tax=Flagellimonas spongiicola TaxID=2942208 RepID=A0ABT0PXK2_9FLAO|nr:hypothetical protein [Allomuricauda spongiicola]MCL6275437.1 hypothetical protein [Allomuricauda spongiicola]
MRSTWFVLLSLIFLCCEGQTKKKYEDYNDEDFSEVQGIIIKTTRKTDFKNVIKSSIHFIYNLDKERPDMGYELNTSYMVHEGEPVIILVHKDDYKVSYFGARGIVEEDILLNYLDKCEKIGGGYYGVEESFFH